MLFPKRADRPGFEASGKSPGWSNTIGGLAVLAVGIIFIIGGVDLGIGQPTRLGPGAFPALTGLILAGLAVGIIHEALTEDHAPERPDWVAFVAINGALMVFALIAPVFGLVPAVFLATITASLPDRSLRPLSKVALGTFMALICWGLFIGLLDLPFKSFRGF